MQEVFKVTWKQPMAAGPATLAARSHLVSLSAIDDEEIPICKPSHRSRVQDDLEDEYTGRYHASLSRVSCICILQHDLALCSYESQNRVIARWLDPKVRARASTSHLVLHLPRPASMSSLPPSRHRRFTRLYSWIDLFPTLAKWKMVLMSMPCPRT